MSEKTPLLGLAFWLILFGSICEIAFGVTWQLAPNHSISYYINYLDNIGYVLLLLGFYSIYKYITSTAGGTGHPNLWKVGVSIVILFTVVLSVSILASAWANVEIWRGSGLALVNNFDKILNSIYDFITKIKAITP